MSTTLNYLFYIMIFRERCKLLIYFPGGTIFDGPVSPFTEPNPETAYARLYSVRENDHR